MQHITPPKKLNHCINSRKESYRCLCSFADSRNSTSRCLCWIKEYIQLQVRATETYKITNKFQNFEGSKVPKTTENGAKRTGSLAKRSSEAGNPNITRVWFKYLIQCSKFPTSANAYSLKPKQALEINTDTQIHTMRRCNRTRNPRNGV